MEGVQFDSLNPYESLVAITENDAQALVETIKKIRTPIKIVSIVATNGRHTAYVIGDIRVVRREVATKKPVLTKV